MQGEVEPVRCECNHGVDGQCTDYVPDQAVVCSECQHNCAGYYGPGTTGEGQGES